MLLKYTRIKPEKAEEYLQRVDAHFPDGAVRPPKQLEAAWTWSERGPGSA